jgi:hypothetical protein
MVGFPHGLKPRRLASPRLAALLAASILAASPGAVPACGYHSGSASGISIAHVSSIPVAMAIGGEVAAGRLQPLEDSPGPLAALRASMAMRAFAAMLDPSAKDLPPVAVVLVEAHLWGRTTSGPGGPQFVPHVDGPSPGDVVLVTGEPALRALLAGHVTWTAALASGVVVIDGAPDARERLMQLLAERFSS